MRKDRYQDIGGLVSEIVMAFSKNAVTLISTLFIKVWRRI